MHGEPPKRLIEVDNTTILDHQLEALSMAGIDDIARLISLKLAGTSTGHLFEAWVTRCWKGSQIRDRF